MSLICDCDVFADGTYVIMWRNPRNLKVLGSGNIDDLPSHAWLRKLRIYASFIGESHGLDVCQEYVQNMLRTKNENCFS